VNFNAATHYDEWSHLTAAAEKNGKQEKKIDFHERPICWSAEEEEEKRKKEKKTSRKRREEADHFRPSDGRRIG
jgi:hypothetical protein